MPPLVRFYCLHSVSSVQLELYIRFLQQMAVACGDRFFCRPIFIICLYGFFTYIKPSEPYVTPFLMGAEKNFTEEEVVNQIYPVWSYSYTAFLIPIFLLTDYLRYKPIIMLQGVGYIGCWVLLVTASTVPLMQLMQVFYGLATAAEIGYYSYIYSVVDHAEYQKSTSYVRSSTQLGLFIGSVMSQLLVSVANVDYLFLNYVSLVNVSIGFVISMFLTYPKHSLYFYRQTDQESPSISVPNPSSDEIERNDSENSHSKSEDDHDEIEESPTKQADDDVVQGVVNTDSSEPLHPQPVIGRWKTVLLNLWKDLKYCYSTQNLLRWSIWWALSTCGWVLVVNYIQSLWETIRPSHGKEEETYNGAVEATAQILGAVAAFLVGFLTIDWGRWGEIFLGIGSLLEAVLLYLMATTDIIWVCYIAYVGFIALYNFVITISQFQIAVGMSTERYALVFGMNTFIAVVLNSILTLIIVDDAVLGLDVTEQFIIYSGYFLLVALLYLVHGGYALCTNR